MILAKLRAIRSTPLRLTAILVALFALSSAVSFGVAYVVIGADVDATLQAEIDQKFITYQASEADQAELQERLGVDAAITDPRLLIMHYLPDHGSLIANVAHVPPVSGFAVLAAAKIQGGGAALGESYLARSLRVGQGQLILAQSRSQILEMGEVMAAVVLIGLVPTLLFAGGAGLLAATRARRKIETIQTTLGALTSGQMSARVPETAQHDDLWQIGAAVNTMAQSQEALIASLRQISADIAHDLKTPIQRVAVILDQIAEKTPLSPQQDALLSQARDETQRIVQTFQALLQLAQIEGGAVRDRFVLTDLAAVAGDVFEFLEPQAEEQGYHLAYARQGDAPVMVLGDRHLLTQALANLIQNGLRHTDAGAQITVSLDQTQGRPVLAVSDNGAGIPQAEHENVLRRHYRMEKSRTTDGNGLGLSLVAAICELHGAELRLSDNTPGLRVEIVF